MNKIKAVIYARYSLDSQREESIEGQIRECTAFAEKNGITILRHYIDRAFSAKTDNRPEFQNMIKDSGKKLFDIDAFKQPVQFLVTGKQGFQFLLLQFAVGLRRLLEVPNHRFQKFILIEAGELRQATDFTKHHLFQKIHSDIVGGSTVPTVALVVGAVEIFDLRVSLIEMEVKIAAAVSTTSRPENILCSP